MIYGITAFAGFEAAAALGEEARDTHRSVPASIIGIVIVTGIFYLLVNLAEMFGVGRRGIPGLIAQPSPLGILPAGTGRRRRCGSSRVRVGFVRDDLDPAASLAVLSGVVCQMTARRSAA